MFLKGFFNSTEDISQYDDKWKKQDTMQSIQYDSKSAVHRERERVVGRERQIKRKSEVNIP